MDMPLWLRRPLWRWPNWNCPPIVASDYCSLYDYLRRALAPDGPIRPILDAPGGLRIDDEKRRQHFEGMLQSHGLSVLMK